MTAVERYVALGDAFMTAVARLQAGVALLQLGEFSAARMHLEACLPALREIRDWKFTLVALIALGHVTRFAGDPAGAARPYVDALALCRDSGAAGDLPLCLEGLAAAVLVKGRGAAARGRLDRA